MNKKLTAVLAATTMVGAIGFTSIASSADYDFYGSIRGGAVYSDSDTPGAESVWDFGATGNDGRIGSGGQEGSYGGLYSRIGVKGSTDLGNGSSAGLHFERDVTGSGFSPRHTNVWVNAGWGKLTLGQQDNPYRNARNWDQTWFLGGQFGNNTSSRYEGIKYSSNLSGPFQFSIMATGDDKTGNVSEELPGTSAVFAECTAENIVAAGTDGSIPGCAGQTAYAAGTPGTPLVPAVVEANAVLNAAGEEVTPAVTAMAEVAAVAAVAASGDRYQVTPAGAVTPAVESVNSVDRWVWAASLDLGGVALNLAYDVPQEDNTDSDNTAFGVNGSAGSFGWYVAYETASDNTSTGDDVSSLGGFVSLDLSPSDRLYFYHVSHSHDVDTDNDETILGYSHSLGAGTTFIAEYLTTDNGVVEPSILALVLKVDF